MPLGAMISLDFGHAPRPFHRDDRWKVSASLSATPRSAHAAAIICKPGNRPALVESGTHMAFSHRSCFAASLKRPETPPIRIFAHARSQTVMVHPQPGRSGYVLRPYDARSANKSIADAQFVKALKTNLEYIQRETPIAFSSRVTASL